MPVFWEFLFRKPLPKGRLPTQILMDFWKISKWGGDPFQSKRIIEEITYQLADVVWEELWILILLTPRPLLQLLEQGVIHGVHSWRPSWAEGKRETCFTWTNKICNKIFWIGSDPPCPCKLSQNSRNVVCLTLVLRKQSQMDRTLLLALSPASPQLSQLSPAIVIIDIFTVHIFGDSAALFS